MMCLVDNECVSTPTRVDVVDFRSLIPVFENTPYLQDLVCPETFIGVILVESDPRQIYEDIRCIVADYAGEDDSVYSEVLRHIVGTWTRVNNTIRDRTLGQYNRIMQIRPYVFLCETHET